MTRENKLALVVGFGLILFVGILISDHFATAGRTEPADLGRDEALDPLLRNGWEEPTLIDARPELAMSEAAPDRPLGPAALNAREVPIDLSSTGSVKRSRPIETIEMGARPHTTPPVAAAATEEDGARQGVPEHRVRSGESLASISRAYYGTDALYKALAVYNELSDPNALRAGQRLRVPPVNELMPGFELVSEPRVAQVPRTAAPPAGAAPRPEPTTASYTVLAGDTLMEISLAKLGSVRHWQKLYERNRAVIDDPDNLVVGTRLEIPSLSPSVP